MVMIGKMTMYLRILRSTVDEFVVVVFSILRMLTQPPTTGKIPKGSGELKSVNQKKPSVSISG